MKRKYIPLKIQLAAALIQLGLDPKTAQLHHDPALALRKLSKAGKFEPDELDPKHLRWMSDEAHATQTFGPGGEKRITTRGGDIGDAAHLRAMEEKHKKFCLIVLAKTPGTGRHKQKGKSRWPTRKLNSRK